MKSRLIAFIALFVILCNPAGAQPWPDPTWTRAEPAALGWSQEKLAAAEQFAAKIGTTAVMIVHRGQVVASWGDVTAKVRAASVRKSLLSALYGIAVAKEQVDLGRTLKDLSIDDREPALTEAEKAATVRHLLMARSGVYHAAGYESPEMAAKRPVRGSQPPGAFWYYNNWDFNALGTIYERLTASRVFDAFEREIARPIGMEDYRPTDGVYVREEMSEHPAYVFSLSARDLARFGLLFLRQGRWKDQQIVPGTWVKESTLPHTAPADFGMNYGYMWWVATDENEVGRAWGAGSYFALGYRGQVLAVSPTRELVIVTLTHVRQLGGGIAPGGVGALMRLILAAAPM